MVDLNRLRKTVKENQRNGDDFPADFWNQAFVEPDGKIQLGRDRGAQDGRPKSQIHQGVFAAYGNTLFAEEQEIVEEFLPATTEYVEVDGQAGWLYDFDDELGNWYQMFLYHDGSHYQVQVVYPELENAGYGVHDAHLYSTGRICLTDETGGGFDGLQETYAKSVLWANGFSIFQETGQFPFSINNGEDDDAID